MTCLSLSEPQSYDSDPKGFLDQASYLARASELAYEDDAELIASSLSVPSVTTLPHPSLDPLPNTQGFWFRHEGIACLVFRGSANRGHWLSNFKVVAPAHPNHPWGTVHHGFAASFEAIIPSVMAPFAAAAKDAGIVWLAGHSLGGALAVHAAAWLRIHTGLQPHLRTYGQPMPGFDDFRARFQTELPDRLVRFINQSDLVPRLPGVGYAHCGKPKTITRNGELQAFGAADEALQLTDQDAPSADSATLENFLAELEQADDQIFAQAQVQGMIGGQLPWIAHHSMTEYVLQLQSLRAKLS